MARKTRFASCLGATLLAGGALAADVTPGLWEITVESRVPAAGFSTGPLSLTQCFTTADARDPSRIVGPLATPGATGCDFTERSYSGSTFRFALDCQGSYGLKSRGSVTFGATSFEGGFSATGNVGGQAVELENRVSGKRLGDC
jgi:hypothetical protein